MVKELDQTSHPTSCTVEPRSSRQQMTVVIITQLVLSWLSLLKESAVKEPPRGLALRFERSGGSQSVPQAS